MADSEESNKHLIIKGLIGNRPYLLLYGLGLPAVGASLTVAGVGLAQSHVNMTVIGLTALLIVIAAAVVVILYIEPRPQVDSQFLATMPASARESFLGGPEQDAKLLSGRWRVRWFEGIGDDRKSFPGDPEDEITIRTNGSRLSCESLDPSTEKIYWLDGRLAHGEHVTLIYWSSLEPQYRHKVGALFLTVSPIRQDGRQRMIGTWTGFSEDRRISHGEVEWEQLNVGQ